VYSDDPKFLKVKHDLFEILKVNKKKYLHAVDSNENFESDNSTIVCDMNFPGYPFEYVNKNSGNLLNFKEKSFAESVFTFFTDDLKFGQNISSISVDTSLGIPFFKKYNANEYLKTMMIAGVLMVKMARILNKYKFHENIPISLIYRELFNETGYSVFVKMNHRTQIATKSKSIVVEGKEQDRDIFTDTRKNEYTVEYANEKAYNREIYRKAKLYDCKYFSTARWRNVYGFPAPFKVASFKTQGMLASLKDRAGKIFKPGRIDDEILRLSPFGSEGLPENMSEDEFHKYLEECIYISGDVPGMDKNISEQFIRLFYEKYGDKIIGHDYNIFMYSRFCNIIGSYDQDIKNYYYYYKDHLSESSLYKDFPMPQLLSGDPLTTMINCLCTLSYIGYSLKYDDCRSFIEDIKSNKVGIGLGIMGDDWIIIFHKSQLKRFKNFLDSTGLKFSKETDKQGIDKEFVKYMNFDGDGTGDKIVMGLPTSINDKVKHLKQVLIKNDGKFKFTNIPLSFANALVSHEGDYNYRSNGTFKENANLGFHLRLKQFSNIPNFEETFKEIDRIWYKYFKRTLYDEFPLNKEQLSMLNKVSLKSFNEIENAYEYFDYILNEKPELIHYMYSSKDIPIEVLDEFYLNLNSDQVDEFYNIILKNINRDVRSLF
jgi:hypothetical protein